MKKVDDLGFRGDNWFEVFWISLGWRRGFFLLT